MNENEETIPESRRKIISRHLKDIRTLELTYKQKLGKCKNKMEKREITEQKLKEIDELKESYEKELIAFDMGSIDLSPSTCPSEIHSSDNPCTTDILQLEKTTNSQFYGIRDISKSQKRKLKKQKELLEKDTELDMYRTDPNNLSINETNRLIQELNKYNLSIHEILSDGHCMFRAIEHQLKLIKDSRNYTYLDLRCLAADCLEKDKHIFEPFFENQITDNNLQTYQSYDDHCTAIRTTSSWGGELELNALSRSLSVSIEIYQADSPHVISYNCNEIQTTEIISVPIIRLTFHKYQYSSGGHYNSVVSK